MKAYSRQDWYIVKPRQLFLVVLGIIFGVEATVMLILPWLLPSGVTTYEAAVVDACLLTGTLAPLMWWLVIRPLRELAEALPQLLSRILTAQEDERARIARDLHDGLGQSLTCLTVGLRAVEEQLQDELVRHQLQDLRRLGADTHEDIRRLVTGLRPRLLDDLGLAAALERYFDDVSKMSGVKAELDFADFGRRRLPQNIETALYRITQEATSNALRHGEATEICVSLRHGRGAVKLEVRDNGRGFNPQAALRRCHESWSFGLCSLRERVALLSGSFEIESKPGVGSVISVRIPLPAAEGGHDEDSSAGR